jgi:hypothetical protein
MTTRSDTPIPAVRKRGSWSSRQVKSARPRGGPAISSQLVAEFRASWPRERRATRPRLVDTATAMAATVAVS